MASHSRHSRLPLWLTPLLALGFDLLLAGTATAGNQITISAEQIKSLAITTQAPQPATLTPQGVVPGHVMVPPALQHLATVPFDGVIVGVHVQDGQHVRAGQPLLTLRSRDAGLAAADATRLVANAKVAQVAAERDHMLVAEGIAANRRAAESRADADAASASAQAAQSALQGLKRGARADEFVLLAPAAGVIAERGLHMTDEVKANTVALVITQGRERWVEAQLPESLLHAVRVGDSAQLTGAVTGSVNGSSTNQDNNALTGKIIAIGQQIDTSTRSVLLRASFDAATPEHALQLLPGRSVQLIIASRNTEAAFRVPAMAVVRIGNQDVVFVRNANGFAIVPVLVSARVDGFTVIRGAITSATLLAVNGVSSLKGLAQNSSD